MNADADIVQYGGFHQMRFQKNYVYVDDDVFGFTINAADYLKRHSRRGVS